jgi:glycosyltransferase involved in cell wall biosynthesis
MYRGIQLVYLPSVETRTLSTYSAMALASLHASFRDYDVVLACNVASSPFCLLPKLGAKRIVINVDGLEWLRPKWGALARRIFKLSARLSKHTGDVLVADAAEMRRVYAQEFGAASVVIAYGATIGVSERPEILAQYGLSPCNYLLTASRLVPDNNPDLIIEAFSGVETEMLLAMAGGVPYASPFVDGLKRRANERVRLLGHIDDADHVKELHCNAYAYVHGHEFGGTNPALLKALGFGNCVLALDTPFNREVLEGGYGILFRKDPDDLREQLQAIVDDPERRATMARRARDRISEAYTWEQIADEYEALFESLR